MLEQRIECPSGKILARITHEGIKFWCERHKREELRTWEEIDALRRPLTDAHSCNDDPYTISKNLL